MPKLLIVEDNTMFREILKDALISTFESLEIEELDNGGEVIDKVREYQPDLVFMDIGLPHENGLNLTKKIKNQFEGIPVIIITGFDNQIYYHEAIEAGVDYFFSKKNLRTEDLIDAVKSFVFK